MSVFLSPVFNDTQLKDDGTLAIGYELYTYAEGSTSPLTTYTTSDGDVPQSNPIVLNARGEVDDEIWLTGGAGYKFVLKTATGTTVRTIDNVRGTNDTTTTVSQWLDSGVIPTYVSSTSFTLPGDQSSDFHVGRRLKSTVTAGTAYSSIATVVYTSLTTVTVVNDAGSALDSGLSAVSYGLLTNVNKSIPESVATVVELDAEVDAIYDDIYEVTQNQAATKATTTGSGSAYVLTISPALATYTNALVKAVLHADPSGSPTVNINSLGAKNLKYFDSTGTKQFVTTAQAKSGHLAELEYDGTDVILLNPLPPHSSVLETSQATTSGTSKDFTGIPAWAKEITIGLSGVSVSGTSILLIQIGDSDGIETSGYVSTGTSVSGAGATVASTAGFILSGVNAAAYLASGSITIFNVSGNEWVADGSHTQVSTQTAFCGGRKELSATLDRVRLTTVNGTDTFDAGLVNISYE